MRMGVFPTMKNSLFLKNNFSVLNPATFKNSTFITDNDALHIIPDIIKKSE